MFEGECPICQESFLSRYPKKYCSLKCYVNSQQNKDTQERLRVKYAKQLQRDDLICLQCEKKFYAKSGQNAKFCSMRCYREYYEKRFDRWIASPQTIALPQNFDEFLTLDELPCLVDGCDWRGQNLSFHMNMTHGIKASQFKKMVGFNLTSGIVTPITSRRLSDAAKERRIKFAEIYNKIYEKFLATKPHQHKKEKDRDGYVSLEGKEHQQKTRALLKDFGETGPERTCRGCKKFFTQPSKFGKKSFCSEQCRTHYYLKQKGERQNSFICEVCKKPFMGNYQQRKRVEKGLVVVCSYSCRQKRAGHIARGTWSGK